jgi:acyl-CoA synthetase (AMP-forming)/AMP-acid ligase II
VQGSATTTAYVGRHEANAMAKMRDTDGRIIHRMGDLGYFDPQGRLWYCGRKSHRVVSAEGTLFTECVEGIFNTHPMVHRTALVGVQIDGITTPLLCVELQKTAQSYDHKDLLAELLALGAQQALSSGITRILIHPGFPTDIRHNSKIIREKLTHWAQEKVRR